MTDKLFYKLWKDAIAQPDEEQFISGYGYPDFFDDISSDLDTVVLILRQIHSAAHMMVKEIIKRSGLTQAAFACRFCIPLHTVENWLSGNRQPKDYIRLAFCRELGILECWENCGKKDE